MIADIHDQAWMVARSPMAGGLLPGSYLVARGLACLPGAAWCWHRYRHGFRYPDLPAPPTW